MRFQVTLLDRNTHVQWWSLVEADDQRTAWVKARKMILEQILEAEDIDPADDRRVDIVLNGLDFESIAYSA